MDATVETRWQVDESGRYVMPPLQSQFLDWLLRTDAERADAGEPATQVAWAKEHGVNPRTPREWKTDHRFRAEWDARADERNVSTEKVQKLLDVLYETAIETRDVPAMKLWLDHSAKLRPPKKVVTEGDYEKLDDEELVTQLAGELGLELGDE